MITNRLSMLIMLILATVLLGACDDDDHPTPVPLPTPAPFAGSRDQLMANFQTFYEAMRYDYYEDLLHPNFEMFLQASTQAEFPDLGPTIDYDEERRIHQRMFGGQPVTDPDGVMVPGSSAISFQTFQQVAAWAISPPTDVIPDTWSSLYELTFLWDRPGFSTLKVEGQAKFYVAGRDSLHDGTMQTYWQLIALTDLTNDTKNTEGNSWGSVKALYR